MRCNISEAIIKVRRVPTCKIEHTYKLKDAPVTIVLLGRLGLDE